MRKALLALLILLAVVSVDASFSSAQTEKLLLMRQPTLSKTHIVFVYAGDLWIVKREGGEASRLTTGVGTETNPLFSPDGQTIAFTGEYDGNVDLYTVPATGGVPKRLTYHPGADNLAGWTPDGKQLLFVSQRNSYSGRFARLFTMPVDGVFPTEVPLPMGYAGSYSPDGTKLAYEPIQRAFNAWKRYRGGMASPIWIANLADSSVEKIPRTDSNDFNPMWIGDKVYFLSDRNGPVTLFSYDTKTKRVQQLIQNNGLDVKSASASTDGIAYSDKRLNIWYVDIEKGQPPVKVDTLARGFAPGANWSPDSRWLTYAKPLKSWYNAVFVYSLEDGKSTQITDGLSDAQSPVFDQSGKYLHFTASTDIGPRVFGFDMSSYPHRPTRNVYVAVLKKTDPSPLAPESDEEKVAEEKPSEKKDGEKGGQGDKEKEGQGEGEKKADVAQAPAGAAKPGAAKEPPKVTIDFDGISQRILALPIPNRNYVGLDAGKAGQLWVYEFPDGAQGVLIQKFDMEKRKLDKVLDNIQTLEISANGEKMLYRQGQNWFIAATATAGTPAFKPGEGKIKTEEMEVYVDPRAEWNQMYRETWRIERDFFYAPNYHGLDLQATAKKYEPYLASLAHRADLNYLFDEMLGELSVGHLYVRGGDVPNPNRVPGGLLGADYKIENGRYRFAKVYNGENWNPQLRAPLTQPGVNVVAGEYLLAVKGRNVTANDNLYSFFESTAGKQVVIKVGPNPDGSGSREVTVVPIPNETGLRNLAWIEENRRKVDKMSEGKLAYIYLPDTAGGGYTFFNRYYFSQLDKQGAVVDERFNSGGQAADYVIDYLKKPLMSYWAVRDGEDWRQPFGVMPGPKAMLINEYSGSGGDYLPYMFRRAQVGPLIGKRTWGGLVGIGGYPQLIDGGSVTAPHFAFYTPEGKWEIENHGVAPDIEIEFDPKAWREGRDIQLEKAISLLMDELKKNPPKPTQRPAYPNYHDKTKAVAGSGNGSGN